MWMTSKGKLSFVLIFIFVLPKAFSYDEKIEIGRNTPQKVKKKHYLLEDLRTLKKTNINVLTSASYFDFFFSFFANWAQFFILCDTYSIGCK
jgi:hypothetical protein